ncbi:MAG: hypothetical protein ACAI25_18195 [Planctomycetota bacterium]
MKTTMSYRMMAALVSVLAVATVTHAEDKAWKAIPKGETVEYAGKKYVNVYAHRRGIKYTHYDLREYDGAVQSGTKICEKKDVHGMIMTWDAQEPDEFKNKVVKYVLFFMAPVKGSESGPTAGEDNDKKFYAQGWDNSMFALEVDAADSAPREIVDRHNPPQWEWVYAFAVYSNKEWKPTPIRVKKDSLKGPKEGTYAANAILLPENYAWGAASTPEKTEKTDKTAAPELKDGWRAVSKGQPVEYAGKKYVNIYANGRYLEMGAYDLREHDGSVKAGKKICDKKDVKGLVLTWDKQDADEHGNKPVRYVLFFMGEHGRANCGPVSGESEDKKFFAQGWDNSLFAIELDGADAAPKEIVDRHPSIKWVRAFGFAVYSNGEWKPTPVRAKPDSWTGPKEGSYAKNAILLPENYDWPK